MTEQKKAQGGDAGYGQGDEATQLYSAFRPKIEWRHVDNLKPNSNNARTHNRKQRRAIMKSIQRLGFNNPILIDRADTIVAGHGRFDAAKELGISELPVVVLEHLDDDEVRAYMLADNQLAALAGWDDEILAIELQNLVEVNFDLDVTGFEAAKIDFLIDAQTGGAGSDKADEIPEAQTNQPPISRVGDIWQLGPHRLMCGNALAEDHYEKLMGSARADMMFTDPPFNVKVPGHVGGSGAIKHPDFVMANGEMDRPTFQKFLQDFITMSSRIMTDGSLAFVCMDWRSIDLLVQAGLEVFSELKNICIWGKTNPGMGSLYRSQHEMIAVFKHGDAEHQNNIQLGSTGRHRSNLWTYPGVNSFKPGRMEELSMHPTVKPVALVADAIRDVSIRGDIVLDPFMGSGTTIIASHDTGRRAYGLELDPVYVDTAIRRFQDYTGETAIHKDTGQSFVEMEKLRTSDVPLPPSSANDTDGRRAMSEDYDVGYGKPPKHTQFKPGQSGNNNGRPKGAKNLKTELAEELHERIPIKEGGRHKKVSKQRAMIKALTAKAVNGDTRAANTIINMVYRLFNDQTDEPDALELTKADEAILKRFENKVLQKAKSKGKSHE